MRCKLKPFDTSSEVVFIMLCKPLLAYVMDQKRKGSPDSVVPDPSNLSRNPSPPPSDDDTPPGDSIGGTVYSKRWVIGTLTKLVEVVTKNKERIDDKGEELPVELEEELEINLCRLWDMAMNEDVTLFLKEFELHDLFLGIIGKCRNNRLTEICVGILGNMACFSETRMDISDNETLGEVILLLLADPDPPTLIETCRLLLTCLSQPDVSTIWLDRIRQQPSIREIFCFIMSSSTNVELLVKVGQLVDKMFENEQDLMIDWIEPSVSDCEEGDPEDPENKLMDLIPCLLEGAKQLRFESAEGLEIYTHILHLVTTVDAGIQAIANCNDWGQATWEFLYDVTSRELCQPDDTPLTVLEQKSLLTSVFSTMSIIFLARTNQDYSKVERNFPLINRLIHVLEHVATLELQNSDQCKRRRRNNAAPEAATDAFPFLIINDTCREFLSNLFSAMTKETIIQAIRRDFLTAQRCCKALDHLLPFYSSYVKSFMERLNESDHEMAEAVRQLLPELNELE
ncbi:protein SAAL1 [Pelodytes ibericus]